VIILKKLLWNIGRKRGLRNNMNVFSICIASAILFGSIFWTAIFIMWLRSGDFDRPKLPKGVLNIRVADGDTIIFRVEKGFFKWLQPENNEVSIRIVGIDAAEMKKQDWYGEHGKAYDMLARRATADVMSVLGKAKKIDFIRHGRDPYSSRFVGDVLVDGKSLSKIMRDWTIEGIHCPVVLMWDDIKITRQNLWKGK